MREVILDLETTGLSPTKGHKIVEIAAIELIDKKPERLFHCYLNPQRKVPKSAQKIHGLDDDFLQDKEIFDDVADKLIDFIGDSDLVIHNASFDMKFLNSELEESGRKPIPNSKVVDTLKLAREVFPGEKNSLDALCKRLNIDLSNRNIHNGLIDCSLLIDVYRHLSEEEPLSFNTQIYDQLLNALEQSKIEVRKSTNFIWEGIKIFVIVAIVIYVYNLFFN